MYDDKVNEILKQYLIEGPEWKPQPSQKAEGVDDQITNLTGIDRKKSITNKVCPFCQTDVVLENFKDEASMKEFHISGLCQPCQDKVFGEENEEGSDHDQCGGDKGCCLGEDETCPKLKEGTTGHYMDQD
tara:strand:- start:834 stop:1223 length:390 start_codon:yes stop_codon:yes gene_type:complete